MIKIELNNNKFKVLGDIKILSKLYIDMKVRHPNSYYLRQYMPKDWDGCIDYLSKQGYAKTGFLPRVINYFEEKEVEYFIVDLRKELEYGSIPKFVGKFEARPYQIAAVKSILYNSVGDVLFQRGVIGAATNAGKTLIAALLYKSFKNVKALILINNKPLFEQFLEDMPLMFGDNWGYLYGKKLKWADIMICMTPSLRNNLEKYHSILAKYNMVIFDECHLITSKTNKKVLTYLFNATIRVGLSGTPFSHSDKTKNMDVESYFGTQVFTIKNMELMDLGYSTPIVIKIIKGNTLIRIPGDYAEEYREGITISEERNNKSLERVIFNLKRNRYPLLVVCRYHEHVERLYQIYQDYFRGAYSIKYLHNEVKDRKQILSDFKVGKIDILITSLLIKLGQNMPLIKYMQNASSGDSAINALQLIGRAIRVDSSKDKVYYEDFFDIGKYLLRHSKHRIKYYKKEGFKIIDLSKNN